MRPLNADDFDVASDKEVHSNALVLSAIGYEDWTATESVLRTYLKQVTEKKCGWKDSIDEVIDEVDLDLVGKAVESWAKWIVDQNRSQGQPGGER